MPNPRLSFRIPSSLLEQLPTDPDERSRFCLEAITDKLDPIAPADSDLLQRLEILEGIANQFIADKKPKKPAPTDLDEAINTALMQIRPAQRQEARKLFNRLRSVQASA